MQMGFDRVLGWLELTQNCSGSKQHQNTKNKQTKLEIAMVEPFSSV